ncbi:hypothetical protein IQ235_10240 [Oscillatoriales cyanobacterium LEGE 11467]|uniref:Uncharacterized protein n=1 Tax=Zarconia navalis LEGE 11467 TaxID=1828826 RepID=A0A928Z9W4_9CYAN|nr:hypothetical protein [Zarconia navalis]MBE9041156.1 hypothetical protein [Zarconia navalis LEGE 11467]
MDSTKQLVVTRTGEPYQPARVYFDVTNAKTVLGVFNKLRCMYFERDDDAWFWLYENETKRLKFAESYNAIPKSIRPLVIGSFRFQGDRELILDLDSFDRLLKAVRFFDRRINRRAAKIAKLRVVNRLFNIDEIRQYSQKKDRLPESLDVFFDRDDVYVPNIQEFQTQVEKISSEYEEEDDRVNALTDYVAQKSKQPLPEIEELYPNFYEDGMGWLELILGLRHMEAKARWQGNEEFNQYEFVQNLIESKLGETEVEED